MFSTTSFVYICLLVLVVLNKEGRAEPPVSNPGFSADLRHAIISLKDLTEQEVTDNKAPILDEMAAMHNHDGMKPAFLRWLSARGRQGWRREQMTPEQLHHHKWVEKRQERQKISKGESGVSRKSGIPIQWWVVHRHHVGEEGDEYGNIGSKRSENEIWHVNDDSRKRRSDRRPKWLSTLGRAM